jgi:hypothetical protein
MSLSHRLSALLVLGLFFASAACDSAPSSVSAVIPTPTAEAGTYFTSKGVEPLCLLRIGPGFATRAWALRCSAAPVGTDTLSEVSWSEAGGAATAVRQDTGDSLLIATSPDCEVSIVVHERMAQTLALRLNGPCTAGGPLATRLAANTTFFLPAPDSANAKDSESDIDRRLRHARPLAQRWVTFALIARGSPAVMTDEMRLRCVDIFSQGLTERQAPPVVSGLLVWDDGCAGLGTPAGAPSDTVSMQGSLR